MFIISNLRKFFSESFLNSEESHDLVLRTLRKDFAFEELNSLPDDARFYFFFDGKFYSLYVAQKGE